MCISRMPSPIIFPVEPSFPCSGVLAVLHRAMPLLGTCVRGVYVSAEIFCCPEAFVACEALFWFLVVAEVVAGFISLKGGRE